MFDTLEVVGTKKYFWCITYAFFRPFALSKRPKTKRHCHCLTERRNSWKSCASVEDISKGRIWVQSYRRETEAIRVENVDNRIGQTEERLKGCWAYRTDYYLRIWQETKSTATVADRADKSHSDGRKAVDRSAARSTYEKDKRREQGS